MSMELLSRTYGTVQTPEVINITTTTTIVLIISFLNGSLLFSRYSAAHVRLIYRSTWLNRLLLLRFHYVPALLALVPYVNAP